jgi:putative PIN family toxin of toxin-antitoxin system
VARAVLDPNVLVSALIGPSAQLLRELRAGAFELVTSPLLLEELADVLNRPKFRRHATKSEVAAYVDLVRDQSTVMTDPEPSAEPLSEDPDDEYLITLAREARAAALVSGDRHLLRLRGRIPVLDPREFLERLG